MACSPGPEMEGCGGGANGNQMGAYCLWLNLPGGRVGTCQLPSGQGLR